MRTRRRLLIACAIIFSILLYLFFRLILPAGFSLGADVLYGALLAFDFAAVLSLPLYFWNRDEDDDSLPFQVFVHLCFFSMGLLSFLFTFTVLKDLVILGTLGRWELAQGRSGSELVLVLSLGALIWGVLNAFFGLKVLRKDVPIDSLDPGLEGLTIAQISDLHIGNTIHASYISRVVQRVNLLNPDLIVLTGDIIDGMVSQLRPRFEILSQLKAEFGRFYITGNHEFYWEGEAWIAEAKRIGLTALDNEAQTLTIRQAHLSMGGVRDPAPDFSKAIAGAPKDSLKVLLCHQPYHADEAAKLGFDLQLSGHTHAGQFFPWNLVVYLVQPYVQGLHRVGKMWLYVNRGTGHWGPPFRLGPAPEITFLKLVRA